MQKKTKDKNSKTNFEKGVLLFAGSVSLFLAIFSVITGFLIVSGPSIDNAGHISISQGFLLG